MESEFTVESAAQFGKIAEAVAEIVQRGIEALQRLAEAFGSMLDPICRAVDRFLVRLWAECRSLPVRATTHTPRNAGAQDAAVSPDYRVA